MLGRADAGNSLLISKSIFIIAFYGHVKLCSDWGRRVKGSSFTRRSTDHAETKGVDGEMYRLTSLPYL